jgi:hypothetical protein
MKQLICLNNGELKSVDGTIACGSNLKKNHFYTYTHKSISPHGDLCYYIPSAGGFKRCERFRKITKSEMKEIIKVLKY